MQRNRARTKGGDEWAEASWRARAHTFDRNEVLVVVVVVRTESAKKKEWLTDNSYRERERETGPWRS